MKFNSKILWLIIPLILGCEKGKEDMKSDSSLQRLSLNVSGDTSFTLSGDAFLVDEFRATERRLAVRKTWRDDSLSGRLSFFSPSGIFKEQDFPVTDGNKDSLEVVFYFNITPTSKLVGYAGTAAVTDENQDDNTMRGEFDIDAIRLPQNDTVNVVGSFHAFY